MPLVVTSRAKMASLDAAQSLKVFAKDPTGGLLPVYQSLDKARALSVGIVFGVIFDLCIYFGIQQVINGVHDSLSSVPLLGLYAMGMASSRPGLIQLLALGIVPFVSMAAAIAAARMVFRGTGSYEGDVFTAGASLLPCGLFVLASSLLGIVNVEVICVLAVFALCYTILMIYIGCARIGKMSDGGAGLAVPIILLLSTWLMKIIYVSILQMHIS